MIYRGQLEGVYLQKDAGLLPFFALLLVSIKDKNEYVYSPLCSIERLHALVFSRCLHLIGRFKSHDSLGHRIAAAMHRPQLQLSAAAL